MSSSRKRRMLISAAMVLAASSAFALAAGPGHYGYGKPASQAEIAGWDIDVRGDDGAGLPLGKESAAGAPRSMPPGAPPATEPLARAKAACPSLPALGEC